MNLPEFKETYSRTVSTLLTGLKINPFTVTDAEREVLLATMAHVAVMINTAKQVTDVLGTLEPLVLPSVREDAPPKQAPAQAPLKARPKQAPPTAKTSGKK